MNTEVISVENKLEPLSSGRPKHNRLNVAEALKLRLQRNYTYQQLSDHFQISKQAIHQRLRRFSEILDKPEVLEDYHSVRGDILSALEFKLLEKILDKDTLAKASLNNAAYAFDKVFNANRLERGQSTANLAIKVTDAETSDLELIAKQMAIKAISVEDVDDNTDNQGDSEADNDSSTPQSEHNADSDVTP